jgi:hypothetical protein
MTIESLRRRWVRSSTTNLIKERSAGEPMRPLHMEFEGGWSGGSVLQGDIRRHYVSVLHFV